MATSTIHAVRLALRDALTGRAGLTDVRVSIGPPLPRPPGEFVWIGDSVADGGDSQEARALGRHKRREEYRVSVVVYVYRAGGDMEGVAERAFELLAEVEDAVREAPDLTGDYLGDGELIDVVFAGVQRDELRADENARECRVYSEVRVRARI